MPSRTRVSLKERIRRLVADSDGCWIWQGRITRCGYGQMTMAGQRKEYAHRVAYTEYVGAIPSGFAVDHLCRRKACVNPEHLEAVTYSENVRRWWAVRNEQGSAALAPLIASAVTGLALIALAVVGIAHLALPGALR